MHFLNLYECIFLLILGRIFFFDFVWSAHWLGFFSLMYVYNSKVCVVCLMFCCLVGFGVSFPVCSFHLFCVLFSFNFLCDLFKWSRSSILSSRLIVLLPDSFSFKAFLWNSLCGCWVLNSTFTSGGVLDCLSPVHQAFVCVFLGMAQAFVLQIDTFSSWFLCVFFKLLEFFDIMYPVF